MTKIQVSERILHKIENFNPNEERKNKLDIVCKFSYSNENEILGNKNAPMSPPTTSKLKIYNTSCVVNQMKNKSKSEEKFNNSPSYQIFLAKYSEIKKQLLRFKNKARLSRLSKIPSNNSSLRESFVPEEDQKENEDNQESSEENEEENGDDMICSLTEKKSRKFKEDVNPFRAATSNSSLYYLGPVKEEKKEDISETSSSSSSSSDSSDDDDSGGSQDTHKTHKTINTNRTHNTHESKIVKVSKLKSNTKPPANHEDNNEDNFDDHDEISLKKGYMSDENECGTATMKRRT